MAKGLIVLIFCFWLTEEKKLANWSSVKLSAVDSPQQGAICEAAKSTRYITDQIWQLYYEPDPIFIYHLNPKS